MKEEIIWLQVSELYRTRDYRYCYR